MGLPQIMINFKTAGGTAVRRSARGQAVLLLAGEESGSVCFLLPEQAERAGLSERAARLVKLCFLGNPARVWLATYAAGEEQAALAACEKNAEGGWLCAPDMPAETVSAFVRAGRAEKVHGIPDDIHDILPVYGHDGDHGPQVQEHVKAHVPLLRRLQMKHVLQHGQVAGAGNGQEFRDSLHEAQKNG